jgi:predicted permease
MDFIVGLHSLLRWLVVVAAVAAVIRYVIDLAGKSPDVELGRKLMMAYTILLDVNVLLGIILLVGHAVGVGQILPIWIEHAVTNLIAVTIAHIFAARSRKMPDPKRTAAWRLAGVVVSMALIVLGVARIGGWS